MTQLPEEPPAAPEPGPDGFTTGAVYGVLFMFGVVVGTIGGFTHSWYAGVVPAGAIACLIGLAAALLATGRLMRARLGALIPALGWFLISMLLTWERPAGDLVIAGNLAGYIYLYGGAVVVVVAVLRTKSPWQSMERHR